ncbi:MAG: hypothetical protein C4576_24575 [Desulfobacteraceae bacterium]|nr:MAG: hypothetical protein C4576_24575 [Desulfobacteraceae bacterium]
MRSATRRFLLFSLLSVLLFTLLPSVPAGAWTEEILEAAKAVEKETANPRLKSTPRQKGLVFKHNRELNLMRIKGLISHDVYQACQRYYAEKNFEIAARAAKENGVELTVQKRDVKKAYDAGTDSDYIGNVRSADQAKGIQNRYNSGVDEFLRESGIETKGGENWAVKNDVDIMADPKGLSANEFEKIAEVNNDAYKRPGAAEYEKKSRSGESPTLKETEAYLDEMRDFIEKKGRSIQELSNELREISKQPDASKPGTETHKRVLSLEAEVQLKQAQKSKYFERLQSGTAVLAEKAGMEPPDASALPSKGKQRAPTAEVGPKLQQIRSAAVDASTGHLKAQSAMNEARVLAVLGANDPAMADSYKKRIVELGRSLTPNEKGELVQLLRENPRVSDDYVQSVNREMRAMPDPSSGRTGAESSMTGSPSSPKVTKLSTAGSFAGVLGDLMSIKEQLEKAERGDHLFFNIEEGDSQASRFMKQAAAAALELAPIPVIDAMERGWEVDEEEKAYIQRQIRLGSAVNPLGSMFRVTGKIVSRTVRSITIDPLEAGWQAGVEGKSMAQDLWKNWQDDKIRQASAKIRQEKYEDVIARMEFMELAPVTARRGGFEGPLLIGEAKEGEILAFEVERSAKWTDRFFTRWEVTGPGRKLLHLTTEKGSDQGSANRFSLVCKNFPPGTYRVFLRMFDRSSGKQMDFSEYAFAVSGEIGLGTLRAYISEFGGAPLEGRAEVGDVLAFEVERIGAWADKHLVEWFLNGETYKNSPASDPKVNLLRFRSDHLDPGIYTVGVRVLDKGSGKILAHQGVRFELKGKEAELPSEFPVFEVKATRGEYQAPPVDGPLENGETVALRALVPHPETEKPLLTNLIWQLYDERGAPVSRYHKQVQASETGGEREYRVRFLLEGLSNGKYTAALTHQLALKPEVRRQGSVSFTLFQPVRITRIWATDEAGDETAKESLRNDQLPHLYLTFEMEKGIEAVRTKLTARNKKTGAEIYSLEREYRRKDRPEQRTGVRLAAGAVKVGDEVEFEAAITSAHGKPQVARTSFTVEGYPVSLAAPSRLRSGDQGRFSVSVPDNFEPPLMVEVSGRGLTIGRPSAQALSGTVSGFSESGDKAGTLVATVTDAAGRTGRASASVTIVASENLPLSGAGAKPSTQPAPTSAGCKDRTRTVDQATLMTPGIVKLAPLNCAQVEWKIKQSEGYFTKYQVKKGTDVKHGQFLDYTVNTSTGQKWLKKEGWYLDGKGNGPFYEYSFYGGRPVMNNVWEEKDGRYHGGYWVFTSSGELNKKSSCVNGKCR